MKDKSKCDICDAEEVIISGVRSDGDAKLSLCLRCKLLIEEAVDKIRKERGYKGPYVVRPVGDGDFVLIPVGGGEVK